MYPSFFSVAAADATVTGLFGTTPTRIYPFGEAPQKTALPYAVWQIVAGAPENYLSQTPDIDSWTIQIDVYGSNVTAVRSGAEAIRDAIEGAAHVTGWRGESRDPDTNNYRYSFDVDWWETRT